MKIVERKNIRSLSCEEKDDLVRAFAGIQKLDPTDPNSFFMIAGYHGEPFRGAGWGNPQWWGGYCNHGNVLFPTWHRAYLHRLEKALQTIVPGIALAYWDETEEETLRTGIPPIFLQPVWKCQNGEVFEPNPLYSYKFQANITDRLSPIPDNNYSKAAGYQTVRYPFSGLVGTEKDRAETEFHNAKLRKEGLIHTDGLLNRNVVEWLNKVTYTNYKGKDMEANVAHKYRACLNAPNYTVFSNTTSATQWNDLRVGTKDYVRVVPLESPHNSMHLAVGGFEVRKTKETEKDKEESRNAYANANGDMGENDTAAFDPIFFFHHCFVDLVFYEWQKKWNALDSLEIIPGYPGTNSVDSQGPTPGVAGGTWLSLDSALDPFKKPGSQTEEPMTSHDVVDPLKLGYKYVYDSHKSNKLNDGEADLYTPSELEAVPAIEVSNINRASIGGSFMVNVYDQNTGNLVGNEAILSRWHVSGCANCQNHLDVRTHIALHGWSKQDAEEGDFKVLLQARNPKDAKRWNMGFTAKPEDQNPKFRIITSHMD